MSDRAVKAKGIVCPFIREGDDIVNIVTDAVMEDTAKEYDQMSFGGAGRELGANLNFKGDIIGITESVVARSAGLYVTVDEIANYIKKNYGEDRTIVLVNPIYSRNRFAMILKAIARASNRIIIHMPQHDEVGNPVGVNPFTGVNIREYYTKIVNDEGKECDIREDMFLDGIRPTGSLVIHCNLHDYDMVRSDYKGNTQHITLADICADKNPDFGLLGSNKATEEKLKLFPTKALADGVCEGVRQRIKELTGKDVYVCCYGDGCFHDPVGGIWEYADPTTMPGYTNREIFEACPNEVKLKAVIDETENDEEVMEKVAQRREDLKGKMASMGTTPRIFKDLIASLCDLVSGSGDRQTPVILIQNYF